LCSSHGEAGGCKNVKKRRKKGVDLGVDMNKCPREGGTTKTTRKKKKVDE